MPDKPAKVLIIGSGPIIIGQAAEFDYAGTQACKAMREEGVISVLVNSNPATIMTDEGIADIVYIEPLTVDVVSRIIERERPDGLLPTLGGQTGLNLAVALAEAGVLDSFNVRLLGTPLDTIRKAEDRELFRQLLAGHRRAGSAQRDRHQSRRGAPRRRHTGAAARRAPRLHARRHRRRHRPHARAARADCRRRPGGQPDQPGAAGAVPPRLERDRVRGDARRRRQLHHRLQHGEPRPDGRAHRRQHRRRAQPDAERQGIPDAALRQPAHHPRARHRRRLQHPVRPGAATGARRLGLPGGLGAALLRHRGQPARLPQLRPRQQGDRLPDSARRRQDRRRQDARPDSQRRHRQDDGRLRAGAGLRRRQDTALALRQVRVRRPQPRHADEGHRRGDGHRPLLRGCAPEGGALAGVRQPLASLGGPGVGGQACRERIALRPAAGSERRAAVGAHGVAAARRRADGAGAAHRRRALVPLQDGEHRRHGEAPPFRALRARPAARGQADRLLRQADWRAGGPPHRAGALHAQAMGHPAGVQDGRYLRRRVRRRHALFLQHLRAGERGAAGAREEGARHRLRADPHRPGHRVRLLQRARGLGAGGGRLQGVHRELQPRDGLDRLRHQRPPLLRAAGRRSGARHPGERDRTRTCRRRRSSSSAARRR